MLKICFLSKLSTYIYKQTQTKINEFIIRSMSEEERTIKVDPVKMFVPLFDGQKQVAFIKHL